MGAREKVLITVAQLAEHIRAGEPLTILDVRWRLDAPDGHATYLEGHLPGAVYVPLEDELSDPTVAGRGRHPLPTGRNLEAAARRWGVRREKLVVAYDDWNRVGSGRVWWLLTASGLTNIRILDGGLAAWRAAGGELEAGEVTPAPGNVTLLHEDMYDSSRPTLTAEQVDTVTLLDARPPERFRGDGDEPGGAVAGHIPGAKSLPCGALLTDDGTFLSDDALAGLLADRGAGGDAPVAAYCGSGISATVVVAALATLGRQAALYPGSWSEWSADPSHPVARGSES